MICCGEEHERRNRDVAGHERQRFCCCGGHGECVRFEQAEVRRGACGGDGGGIGGIGGVVELVCVVAEALALRRELVIAKTSNRQARKCASASGCNLHNRLVDLL